MTGKRTLAVALVLALAVVPGVVAADLDVTVQDVTVTPAEAVPGDEVTVEATVANLESSDGGYEIDRVVLESTGSNSEEFDDVANLGTIPAGQSRLVPLSATFENPGTYRLRVKVYGHSTATDRRTTVQYPVTVEVSDRTPQVDVDANDTAVGVTGQGSVTVVNSLGSPVEDVELTVDGADVAITNRREVLATLESGDSRTVDFEFRPESAGTHTLNATLTYTTLGGTTDSVTERVTINAERIRPQLDVSANDSVAGVESGGSVTVANGIGTGLRNVELTVGGEGVTVRDDRSVFTRIADGESVETAFDFEPESAGTHTLNATLSYTTGGGTVRTVSETVTVEADPLRDRVSLDVSTTQGGGSQVVVVDVINQGNAPATNVTVSGSSPNASVQRALVDDIAQGESRTVRLNTTLSADSADLDVRASYDLADERGETTVSTALTQTPGTIGLTGIQVVPEGGRLRISGSASNLGTTDAQSVLVSVVEREGVTAVEPNPEFFVGPVPASDFASFDVYAATQGNVTEIPLEVSYIVDGDRRTRTVSVDVAGLPGGMPAQQGPSSGGSDGGGGGGFPVVAIAIGLVVVLVVLAIIVVAWRSSRGGD
jgi:hypothetical protein